MYQYHFRLVDLRICIESPFELKEFHELSQYRTEHSGETPDAVYTIRYLPEDWTVQGTLILNDRKSDIYEVDGEYHQYFYWSVHTDEKFVLLVSSRSNPEKHVIYVQRKHLESLLVNFRLTPFLAMEQLLLRHKAFQLHSSVIEWRGQGILFSAPSGTGKSTQAELWRTLEGAQVINGDKAMIRQQQGKYVAYGSPYAGTSGIYTDLSVPIRAIVVLSQAPENRLERLSPTAAFGKLYRESTVPAWDPDFVEKISELIIDLIGRVPVYHLACRPDAEAVEVLKNELTKE